MTTFLGSYERKRRAPLGEVTRVGRLVRLSDDTMTGVVELAGREFELPVAQAKYVLGAYVSVLESRGKPRRVLGPASVRPEGLATGVSAPPPVTGILPLAPRELTADESDLIYNSADLIDQVAEDTDTALTNLTNALSDLGDGTSRTQFKVGPPTSPGRVEGDQWIEIDNDGDGVTGWRWTGSNWVEYQLTDAMFDSVGINKLDVKGGHFDSAIIEQLGVDGLDARMIRTSALHIAAGNLIPNGDGRTDYSVGNATYYPGYVPAESAAVGSWAILPNTTGTYRFFGDEDAPIRTTPGEEYELTYWAHASGAGQMRVALRVLDADYESLTYNFRGPTEIVGSSWQQYRLSIPASWITGPFLEISFNLLAGITLWVAGADLRPKVGGRLVVDGVMDGKTIVGGEFLTSSDTANAAIWDSDGLRIYRDGALQAELSPNNNFGLTVRHPDSGQMLPLSTHVFGNEVWAPVPAYEFQAKTNPPFTDAFGEVVGTFTAITDRYMISHTAQPPGTHLDAGWFYQNYGVEFHRPATGWRARASMGSIQSQHGGAIMDIGTIHLAIGATYEVKPMYRATKPGGNELARVTNRLVHLQPIH